MYKSFEKNNSKKNKKKTKRAMSGYDCQYQNKTKPKNKHKIIDVGPVTQEPA